MLLAKIKCTDRKETTKLVLIGVKDLQLAQINRLKEALKRNFTHNHRVTIEV